jgi:hypothetical protein
MPRSGRPGVVSERRFLPHWNSQRDADQGNGGGVVSSLALKANDVRSGTRVDGAEVQVLDEWAAP